MNKINYNSKNINREIDFSFNSTHCPSFIKTGAKLRGGVCISLVEKYPFSVVYLSLFHCTYFFMFVSTKLACTFPVDAA